MGRRIPRGAGWRLVAVMTLLIALAGMFPSGARAASGIAITVTDDAGTPLAGAAFGVYAASVDLDGALYVDPAAALIGGPVVSDAGGLAFVGDLPDGLTVGVQQLAVPAGYAADLAGDQFVTTDPDFPPSLAVVNAALPIEPVPVPEGDGSGTVTVAVTEATGTVALDGVAIDVQAVDPATGAPGGIVASTASDASGVAEVSLPAGSYVVSVVPPVGYLPADAQPVAVDAPGGEAGATVAFGLQPEPTDPVEPTAVPTDAPTAEPPPTEPAVPTEAPPTDAPPTDAPPTQPTEPAEPAEPTATATASPDEPSAVPSAAETATASPEASVAPSYPSATILVRAIVCSSDDPDLVGTMAITPNDQLVALDATLPDGCRPAQEGEFTFSFRDPRQSSPWDDITLGQRATDVDGVASFETQITREGQDIFVVEQANQNDFSASVPLVADGTVSLIAVRVVGEPEGDVVVRPVDAISGVPIVGTCYDLAAAGVPDLPLASACDADDGADGLVTFPGIANGAYVVVPTTPVTGYVLAPATPLTVDSQPVDLPLGATPYGTLQLMARSCLSAPAGVTVPTPTPASGDGIAGLDDVTMEASPSVAATPAVLFGVMDGSAVDAAGTGLEQVPAATDCTAAGASLTVTAPDGTATSVVVGQDGVASPLSLPPTSGDAVYTIRDDASGATQTVVVNPAGTTTVTMIVLPGGAG